MKHVLLIVMLALAAPGCQEPPKDNRFDLQGVESPFVLVLIDAEDEEMLEGFPVDRTLIAQAIDNAGTMGASGVVLKFFYDRPSSDSSDSALQDAIVGIPTLLQARIDDSEKKPNPYPQKFARKVRLEHMKPAVTGSSGWLPLPELSSAARDVGFVDISDPHAVPAFVSYRGMAAPSLTVTALEMASGSQAVITPDGHLKIGGNSIELDETASFRIRLPVDDTPAYIPFSKLADGKLDPGLLRDKVVVIGYDGEKMPVIETDMGFVKAHRLFYYGLVSTYAELHATD